MVFFTKEIIRTTALERYFFINLDYFGPPVYEYPMWMGQEDGYLVASEFDGEDVFFESGSGFEVGLGYFGEGG